MPHGAAGSRQMTTVMIHGATGSVAKHKGRITMADGEAIEAARLRAARKITAKIVRIDWEAAGEPDVPVYGRAYDKAGEFLGCVYYYG